MDARVPRQDFQDTRRDHGQAGRSRGVVEVDVPCFAPLHEWHYGAGSNDLREWLAADASRIF